MSVKRIIFHTTVLLHNLYALKYSDEIDLSSTTDIRVLEIKTFRYKYATSWNIVCHTIYFALALLHDLSEYTSALQDFKKKVAAIKGYIFATWLFPWTLFIFCMFWGVYSINREWVLPEVSDAFYPSWLNHSVHTNILPFVLIELVLVRQALPSFKSAFIGLSVLKIIYDFILLYTYVESGRWIYRLFYILQWHERILFMIVNYLILLAGLKAGMKLIHAENLKTD